MIKFIVVFISLSLSSAAISDAKDADQGVAVNLNAINDEVSWVEDKGSQSPLTGLAVRGLLPQQSAGLTTSRRPTASDFDPFSTLLRWDWDSRVSVGEGIKRLAKVAGYGLSIRDPRVANVYSMPLPYAHRRVRGIDVKTGLEFLGGPGLMLVVDHPNRRIMHVVRSEYSVAYDLAALPRCPADVAFALLPAESGADRVLIVGGQVCAY